MKDVKVWDLGNVDYQRSWDFQQTLNDRLVRHKMLNRNIEEPKRVHPHNYLLFVEHPHVYTLGKSGDFANLLIDEKQQKEIGVSFYKINRGGDITYHGPGQIVGYPILDLDHFFTDIHKYLRYLEEAIIRTIGEYGLKGDRFEGLTGVWLDPDNPFKARKICAMGIRCTRWVTMHGFALNVNTDLSYFNKIVPCGITDKQVTSLEKELGKKVDLEEVKQKITFHLADIFQMNLV